MKSRILILALTFLLLNSGCVIRETVISPESNQRIHGSGYLIKEIRELPEFNSVSITTCGKVHVTQGDEQLFSVIADDNVLEYIITTVQNGKLVIGTKRGISISNLSLTVNATLTNVEELSTSSSGDIVGKNRFVADYMRLITSSSGDISLDLETEKLLSVISSSGDIYLRGKATQHDATLSSSGDLYAFNLATETTNISVSSSGDAEIYVSNILNVTLSSSGSLFYKGQPTIHQNISSSGRLINSH